MLHNLSSFFNSRILKLTEEKNIKDRLLLQLSISRLLTFVFGVIFVFYFANKRDTLSLILSSGLSISLYLYLLYRSSEVKDALQRVSALIGINFKEIKRLERNLDDIEKGSEFIDPTHHFTKDLAIFGDFSLFQLVNRTSTKNGKDILAGLLRCDKRLTDIQSRQEAVKELVEDVDWRQDFEATKNLEVSETDISGLAPFLASLKPIKQLYLLRLAFLFPILLMGVIVHGAASDFTYYHLIWCFIIIPINGFISFSLSRKYKEVYKKASEYAAVTKGYFQMLSIIKQKAFKAERLNSINSSQQEKANTVLKELSSTLEGLSDKGGLLNAILLTDIIWLIKLEQWRRENHGFNPAKVFEYINDFEVFASFAGFAFLNPGYAYPVVEERPEIEIQAESLGHPLIRESELVSNDFALEGNSKTVILTGPNMSGKSTFLKSVGINIVLALSGGPVCAKRLIVTPVRLFISMKNEDNLKENLSSFYAEIKRVDQLIKLVEQGDKTFYIIDEVFRGTNSEDQAKGAVAVIRHLSRLNASGIVSTHNTQMASFLGTDKRIVNLCFESKNENNKVIFDHKVRGGIAQNFTACGLIQNIGIDIDFDIKVAFEEG